MNIMQFQREKLWNMLYIMETKFPRQQLLKIIILKNLSELPVQAKNFCVQIRIVIADF